MANSKKADESKAAADADEKKVVDEGPAFTERVVAKVNHEGNHKEVILRAESGPNTIVYRGTKGTSKFVDGQAYDVTITAAADVTDAAADTTEE